MSETKLAIAHGHRIAVDTLLQELVREVFGKDQASVDKFKNITDGVVTALHAEKMPPFSPGIDGEFVKQQALHSVDLLFGDTHRRMVEELRERDQPTS